MVWVPCDRCLDDMEQPVSSADKLMVKFGHEYAEEGDNLIVIPEEEGKSMWHGSCMNLLRWQSR